MNCDMQSEREARDLGEWWTHTCVRCGKRISNRRPTVAVQCDGYGYHGGQRARQAAAARSARAQHRNSEVGQPSHGA